MLIRRAKIQSVTVKSYNFLLKGRLVSSQDAKTFN